MKRVLGTILSVLVAAGLSSACGSSPTSPDASATAAFVGLWQNVDAQTGSLPQIQISMQGNQVIVHAWGACFPTYCDWGQATASSSSNGTLSVVWQLGGIEVNTQSLTISGGQLHSALHTHFIDGSGRPDYDAADVFNKVS